MNALRATISTAPAKAAPGFANTLGGVLGSLAPWVRAPLFAEARLAGTLAVLEHAAPLARSARPRGAGHADDASL